MIVFLKKKQQKTPYLCTDTEKLLQRSSSFTLGKRAEAGLYIQILARDSDSQSTFAMDQ